MKIEVTYPAVPKRRLRRRRLKSAAGWLLLFAAYICPIVNMVTGGKAWSVIVLISLYMVWMLLLSTDLVEYNRISQFTRLIFCACALLAAIDVFISSGWAIEVVPIVCFSGLTVAGILFFTDFEKQKQNMLPMLLLIFMAMGASVVGLCLWHEESRWALAVMGAFALALLVACAVTLGSEFMRELRRRFHTK